MRDFITTIVFFTLMVLCLPVHSAAAEVPVDPLEFTAVPDLIASTAQVANDKMNFTDAMPTLIADVAFGISPAGRTSTLNLDVREVAFRRLAEPVATFAAMRRLEPVADTAHRLRL